MKRRRPEISASLRKKFVPPKRKNASESISRSLNSESNGRNGARPVSISQPVRSFTPREKQFHDNPLRSRKRPLVANSSSSTDDVQPMNVSNTPTKTSTTNITNRYSIKNPYAKNSHGLPSYSSKASSHIPGRNTGPGSEGTKRTHTTNVNPSVQHPFSQSSVASASSSTPSSRVPKSIWNPYKKTYQFLRGSTSKSTSSRNVIGTKATEVKNPYANKKTPIRNPYLKPSQGQQQQQKHQWKKREVNHSKGFVGRIQNVSEEDSSSLQGARITPHPSSSSHGLKGKLADGSNTIQIQLQPQPHPTSWKSPSVQTITMPANAKEDMERQRKSQCFSLAGSYTLQQYQNFLKPQSAKNRAHLSELSSSTLCKHLPLHQGLSNPSIRFRPVGQFHHDVKKDVSNDIVDHDQTESGEIHDIKRILPITQSAQKQATKSESVGAQSTKEKDFEDRQGIKEIEPILKSNIQQRTPIVKVSGRPLLVGKRPFVRPVSRQKKRPLAKQESRNQPMHSRSYQKRRLFQEIETQSQSQPLRRPYPFVPTPQVWLQGITANMLRPMYKCTSKSCFLLDAIKEAKMKCYNAHQKLPVGERNTDNVAQKLVRIMGYVTSAPEKIMIDSTLASQQNDTELLSFMFDDSTFQIDALVDENNGKELRDRRVKVSNRIDCIGYIHYTYHTPSFENPHEATTATPVFIIQSLKYVDDPSLETFRMMQILSRSENHASQSPILRNENFTYNNGKHVTCDLPFLRRCIKESKPDGVTEEDLTLLFDLKKGSREKNALLNGLKKLQMDVEIYQTKSGRYLTM